VEVTVAEATQAPVAKPYNSKTRTSAFIIR